jgi:hypothetical protein
MIFASEIVDRGPAGCGSARTHDLRKWGDWPMRRRAVSGDARSQPADTPPG